jgi:hypothetical protein
MKLEFYGGDKDAPLSALLGDDIAWIVPGGPSLCRKPNRLRHAN